MANKGSLNYTLGLDFLLKDDVILSGGIIDMEELLQVDFLINDQEQQQQQQQQQQEQEQQQQKLQADFSINDQEQQQQHQQQQQEQEHLHLDDYSTLDQILASDCMNIPKEELLAIYEDLAVSLENEYQENKLEERQQQQEQEQQQQQQEQNQQGQEQKHVEMIDLTESQVQEDVKDMPSINILQTSDDIKLIEAVLKPIPILQQNVDMVKQYHHETIHELRKLTQQLENLSKIMSSGVQPQVKPQKQMKRKKTANAEENEANSKKRKIVKKQKKEPVNADVSRQVLKELPKMSYNVINNENHICKIKKNVKK